MTDCFLNLLSACIRPEYSPAALERVTVLTAAVRDWGGLLHQAERHGMAPLLYRALKSAAVPLPDDARLGLQALTLRRRLAGRARDTILADLYRKCAGQSLRVITLKGAALAHILYPDPGLRPMRDVDLLVAPQDQPALLGVLAELGFSPTGEPPGNTRHRHDPPWSIQSEGYTITVEVHHALFQKASGESWFQIEDLSRPPRIFHPAGEVSALALNHEDMLLHLCIHAFRQGFGLAPYSLIQIADILNYTEHFGTQMDWDLLKSRYPVVLHTLALLNQFIPLSTDLPASMHLPPQQSLSRIGESYSGWPVFPLNNHGRLDFKVLRATCLPSPWWLCLRYGTFGHSPLLAVLPGKHFANLARRVKIHLAKNTP